MQSTLTGLLAPEAVYLIRTFTVTRYTEQQCCTSCVHISSAVAVRHNKILHLNHSLSVHPASNDPGFLYWCCFLRCMCCLMRVL